MIQMCRSARPNFIVTGGAGYVGRYLVRELLEAYPHCQIKIITRNRAKAIFFADDRVEVAYPSSGAINEHSIVFNLAHSVGYGFKHTRKLNESALQLLFSGLPRAFTGRVIHLSTIAVHGYAADARAVQPVRLTGCNRTDPYTYAKGAAEQFVDALSRKRRIRTMIIRCGNVMGPGSSWANLIVSRLLDGKPLLSARGEHPSNATFVGNVARALAMLAKVEQDNSSEPMLMNFAEFGSIPWTRWISPMAEHLGVQPSTWNLVSNEMLRARLLQDLRVIGSEIAKMLIPLLSSGRATGKLILRILDFIPPTRVAERTKATLYGKPMTDAYMSLQESRTAQVLLSNVSFGLEGVPESVRASLPFNIDEALGSLIRWMQFAGYRSPFGTTKTEFVGAKVRSTAK